MSALTNLAGAAAESARLVAGVATAPARIATAVLDSPRVARRDPSSNRLAGLRRDGWRVTEVRLGARSTEVAIERDGRGDTVDGATLAFAAYATRVGVAVGAAVLHNRVP